MPCFHPITAYQAVDPRRPQGLVFEQTRAYPTKPIKVPCRKCIGCRMDYASEWGVRNFHESQMHDESMFITPTYDEDNVPPDYGLRKEDPVKLIKRMRWNISEEEPEKRIKYFLAGEYGEKTSRPHYHALIFGHRFADEQLYSTEEEHKYFASEELNRTWGKGNVIIADVTPETCNYVANYMLKDLRHDAWKDQYEICDPETGEIHKRIPPYCSMSRNPAIGKSWFEKFKGDCFPKGFVTVQGIKKPVPDYYLYLLEKEDPEQAAFQKELKRQAVTDPKFKWNSTPERLKVRETCKKAKISNLKRDKG